MKECLNKKKDLVSLYNGASATDGGPVCEMPIMAKFRGLVLENEIRIREPQDIPKWRVFKRARRRLHMANTGQTFRSDLGHVMVQLMEDIVRLSPAGAVMNFRKMMEGHISTGRLGIEAMAAIAKSSRQETPEMREEIMMAAVSYLSRAILIELSRDDIDIGTKKNFVRPYYKIFEVVFGEIEALQAEIRNKDISKLKRPTSISEFSRLAEDDLFGSLTETHRRLTDDDKDGYYDGRITRKRREIIREAGVRGVTYLTAFGTTLGFSFYVNGWGEPLRAAAVLAFGGIVVSIRKARTAYTDMMEAVDDKRFIEIMNKMFTDAKRFLDEDNKQDTSGV